MMVVLHCSGSGGGIGGIRVGVDVGGMAMLVVLVVVVVVVVVAVVVRVHGKTDNEGKRMCNPQRRGDRTRPVV